MAGRLHALLLLTWAMALTLVRRLVAGDRRRGIEAFRANFDREGLFPLTPTERAELSTFSRCIACGRCDQGDAARISASRGAYPGTMRLMLTASRSMPEFASIAPAFAYVTDDELAEKERHCPTSVPMRKIRDFVVAKSATRTSG